MSERKNDPSKDPRFAAENQHNRGAEHTDPRVIRDPNRGVADRDNTTFVTKGGVRPDKDIDQSTVDLLNEATTSEGGIAIDGGKLAGHHDDFEGDLGHRNRVVPGADSNNEVSPAHDMATGDTGKTNNPD